MRFRPLFFFFFFLLQYTVLTAQYYDTGQDPGSLKWMQIKTDRFRVIYPASYGKAGIDFTKSLEDAFSKLADKYPVKPARIPVIIHSYTTGSNGYVAWAPKRMEVYPTPEQNSIPLDPDTQLAIHELTHVLQMESINRGTTKVLSFLAGQQVPGIVSSLLPFWYLEGDAVFSESLFTGSGRGRNASFQKQLKALMVEKGNVYKYDKSVNGSFRDFVPDHYRYGYQMMAWSYLKYDRSLWQQALKSTGNVPFLINPVNISLAKSAELTKKRIFNETFDTLKTIWVNNDKQNASEKYNSVNPVRNKSYISYHSPVFAGNDSIVAIKTSLSAPPEIVLIRPSSKTEKRIYIPGNCYPWFISAADGQIYWVETHTDPRWENRDWTVIKKMDIKSKKITQLSFRTRFMSASISPDGSLIAAAENTTVNSNGLVLLDAGSGKRLATIPAPGNAALQRPQWDNTGEKISVISLTTEGEGILIYHIRDNRWETYIAPGFNDLQSSCLRNDSLFFVSSVSGTDNIYLRKPDNSVVSVTNSRFGAGDINLKYNTILFTDYTSSGNNICLSGLSSLKPDTLKSGYPSSFLIDRFDKELMIPPQAENVNTYTPSAYRKWLHLFRFHSWMPFYADIEEVKDDPASIKPGVTLMTQNDLSTLISSFGYEYSENRNKFHYNIKWKGWYLVFESRFDFGDYPYIEKFGENVESPAEVVNGMKMTNTVSLPLLFKGGSFTKYLYLSASSAFSNDNIYIKKENIFDNGQNQLTGRIYFSNYQRSSLRDIYPRFAQVIDLSYSYYPFDKEIYGDIFTARGALYFPGFLKNNGIRLRLEAEKQNPEMFILNNRVSFSRSYSNIISSDIRFASAEYYMPLLYPDFNLSSLFYLTRIRSNLFFDYTRADNYYVISRTATGSKADYFDIPGSFNSYGIELLSDFYLFRMPFMISAGVQASWKEFGYSPSIRMLFNIDLFGMSIGKRRM